jgi:hypothetical protein
VSLDRLLARVPGWLGSKPNIVLGIALIVVLVALPLLGVPVSDHIALVGGNWMNGIGYLGASIAAGASVVNLHEGRSHRRKAAERLDAIHEHLTKPTPPRTGRTRKEPAP